MKFSEMSNLLSYACNATLKQLLITLFLLPLLLWLLPTCPLLLPSSKAAFSCTDNFMGMMSFSKVTLVWHWWFMGSVQYWLNSNKKWRVTNLTFNSGAIPTRAEETKKKKIFLKGNTKVKKHWLFIDKTNLFFDSSASLSVTSNWANRLLYTWSFLGVSNAYYWQQPGF